MVVHSFSKTYCMTGWRVGYLVARRDLAHKASQLNEFIVSHAPSFAQKAAETALADGEGELARMLAASGPTATCAWKHCGPPALPSRAGRRFYLFPAHRRSYRFLRLLPAAAHRDASGPRARCRLREGGEGFVRICYAADRAVLEPAMERLVQSPSAAEGESPAVRRHSLSGRARASCRESRRARRSCTPFHR